MRSTDQADDYLPEEGKRERYTHGYFQVVNTQALLEVVLSETNTALHEDGSVSWYHYWKLIPRVVVPWETPGISHDLERSCEELHFNIVVRHWQTAGLTGPSISSRRPHRENGDFQVARGAIDLGYSCKDYETDSLPKKLVALICQVVIESRMLVYGCRGEYQCLSGILEVAQAQNFLDCADYFWNHFPISELLKYCADSDARRLEYEQAKARYLLR